MSSKGPYALKQPAAFLDNSFSRTLLRVVISLMLTGSVRVQPAAAQSRSASLAVGSVSGADGASVDLPVTLTAGSTGIASLQFDLALPAQLTYVSTGAGAASSSAGKEVSDFNNAGTLRVLVFSVSQSIIGSGEVAIVRLSIPSGTVPGEYTVGINGIVASDVDGKSVPISGSSGAVLLTPRSAD